jgi:hypothetical protein
LPRSPKKRPRKTLVRHGQSDRSARRMKKMSVPSDLSGLNARTGKTMSDLNDLSAPTAKRMNDLNDLNDLMPGTTMNDRSDLSAPTAKRMSVPNDRSDLSDLMPKTTMSDRNDRSVRNDLMPATKTDQIHLRTVMLSDLVLGPIWTVNMRNVDDAAVHSLVVFTSAVLNSVVTSVAALAVLTMRCDDAWRSIARDSRRVRTKMTSRPMTMLTMLMTPTTPTMPDQSVCHRVSFAA